ncbi:hypothetical protein [Massilia sp. TWR1-2-2]
MKMDAIELTFQGDAWWVTKIELRALGRTLPGRSRDPIRSNLSR